jgi:hypothetical protein
MTSDEYTPEQWAQMKRWVDNWKTLGPELERMREEDVRNTDTKRSIRALKGIALMTLPNHPPEPTSGLVEQQRWFRLIALREGLIK